MDLSIIKHHYYRTKNYLKETIFSKNKSILNISTFSQKSIIKKILTFTTINLFVLFPYILFVSLSQHIHISISLLITSITSVLLFSNTLFFTTTEIISLFFNKLKSKMSSTDILIKKSQDVIEVKPQYFEQGFIGKIKEFFIATGSVATTFLPFIILTNIMLFSFLHQYSLFTSDKSFFHSPLYYLKLDSFILIFLTTLTTGSIYSIRFVYFLKNFILKALLSHKINEDNMIIEEKSTKKSFPAEEFMPSLNQAFKKTNNINAYAEMTVKNNQIDTVTEAKHNKEDQN